MVKYINGGFNSFTVKVVKVNWHVCVNKALSLEIIYRDSYQSISTIIPPTGILS